MNIYHMNKENLGKIHGVVTECIISFEGVEIRIFIFFISFTLGLIWKKVLVEIFKLSIGQSKRKVKCSVILK